jgi:uncharacterized protein YprB with RNaseH-like and TPR domain
VIKPGGGEAVTFRGDAYPAWQGGRSNDAPVVRALADALGQYDILVAHNGKKFDIPFLQTRLARWGLPPLPRTKLVDPVLLARNNYRMSSNSLQRLLGMFGLNEKTVVDNDVWLRAALDGDREAMNYIVEHCIKDVDMLDALLDKVKPFCSKFDSGGSAW